MYESAIIDGIELVFDTEADDSIVKMLRDIRDCSVWGCKECSKKISLKISHVASLISNVVKPDDGYIIDIGCHIGTSTLPLAKRGYDVAAIDGSYRSIDCLTEAIKRNNFSNIKPIKSVLSNVNHSCKFPESVNAGASMKIGMDANILTSTIDEIVLEKKGCASLGEKCSLIRIDVQGYEKSILNGGESTLNKYRPILYLEINTSRLKSPYPIGIRPRELLDSIGKLGYHIAYPYWNPKDDEVSFREIDPFALFPFGTRDIICFHHVHNIKDEIMNFVRKRWMPPHSHKKLYQMLLSACDNNRDSPHMDYYNALLTSESSSKNN